MTTCPVRGAPLSLVTARSLTVPGPATGMAVGAGALHHEPRGVGARSPAAAGVGCGHGDRPIRFSSADGLRRAAKCDRATRSPARRRCGVLGHRKRLSPHADRGAACRGGVGADRVRHGAVARSRGARRDGQPAGGRRCRRPRAGIIGGSYSKRPVPACRSVAGVGRRQRDAARRQRGCAGLRQDGVVVAARARRVGEVGDRAQHHLIDDGAVFTLLNAERVRPGGSEVDRSAGRAPPVVRPPPRIIRGTAGAVLEHQFRRARRGDALDRIARWR